MPITTPFTPKTLAARWGCSERHIRHLIERQELPHFRVGNLIRIPPQAVEAHECPNLLKSASDVTGDTGLQHGQPRKEPSGGRSVSRLPLIVAKPNVH